LLYYTLGVLCSCKFILKVGTEEFIKIFFAKF
jgi:hypothetical protein